MSDYLASTLPNTARASGAPPVLLPYQQAWVAGNAQLKIAEKSRRIGLTWAEASDDVLIAAGAGGSNCFYIGPTQDMALEYIEACAMWAKGVQPGRRRDRGRYLQGRRQGHKNLQDRLSALRQAHR